MSSNNSNKDTNMELAAQAEASFLAGEYGAALEALHRIQSTIKDKSDVRLAQNLKLCEVAQGGFKEVTKLRDAFTKIKDTQSLKAKQLSDSDEPAQDASSSSEDVMLGELVMNSDSSILLYNLAALHFQHQEYSMARTILEALFTHIEPIDERVATNICFLLLDVLLHMSRGALLTERDRTQFADQCEMILTHLEKNKPRAAQSSTEGQAAEEASAAGGKDGDLNGASAERTEFDFRVHLYRAKVLLLQQQLKASKKEIKTSLEIYQQKLAHLPSANGIEAAAEAGGAAVSVAASRSMAAVYLKANFEYLKSNHKKALKLLASSHSGDVALGDMGEGSSPGPPSVPASPQGLNPMRTPPPGHVGAMYLNNVACVHHKMRRYQLSLHYLAKALRLSDQTRAGADRGLAMHSDGRLLTGQDCEIRYNLGLQLLLSGRPLEAYHRFREAAQLLYNRPQLWLRLAECCLQHHSKLLADRLANAASGSAAPTMPVVVGTGPQRRLVLPTPSEPDLAVLTAGASPNSTVGSGAGAAGGGGPSVGGKDEDGCNLVFASKCLRNTVALCTAAALASVQSQKKDEKAATFSASANKSKKGDKDGKGSKGEGAAAEEAAAAEAEAEAAKLAEGLQRVMAAEDFAVLQVAYLDLAYVHLCLSDPVVALRYAQDLLKLSLPPTSPRRFLGHMYAAEALCLLSRPAEAMVHVCPEGSPLPDDLALTYSAQLDVDPGAGGAGGEAPMRPPSRSGLAPGFARAGVVVPHGASSSDMALCALHLNIATVYAVQGQLAQAEKCAREALARCPQSSEANRMIVYVLLRSGNTAEALQVLKLCRNSSPVF